MESIGSVSLGVAAFGEIELDLHGLPLAVCYEIMAKKHAVL